MRDTSPDSNFGSATALPVGVSDHGSPRNRGLFQFDLSVIPTNATVTAATLRLIVVKDNRAPADFSLSRVLTNWIESEVTWNSRSNSTPWSGGGAQIGIDFATTPSATALLNSARSTNEFTSSGLASDVQLWMNDPAQNFGWILFATDEPASSGKQVGSKENAGSEPVLSVEYTLPSSSPSLKVSPITNGVFSFSFDAEAGHGYVVQFNGDLTGTNWEPLLVLDPAPAPSEVVIPDPLTTSNRFYRVQVN